MLDPLGIVADDLTGAADALAPFRARGYDCELLLEPGSTSGATVTASVTYSRALPDDEARTRTADAVGEVLAQGRRPYLKIDSTMRGPIPAQLAGALEAARGTRAIICPAYPEMGRTVHDGLVRVDGVLLGESVFTADPRNPVRLSAMAELVPGSTPLVPGATSPLAHADATSTDDLVAVARLGAADPGILLAGSAGLAEAWASLLPQGPSPDPERTRPSHILLVASSRHPVTLAQIEHLPTDLFSVLGDHGAAPESPVTVLSAPSRFTERDAERVLEDLARQAEAFIRTEDVGQLILIGGDGAAAVLNALGARAISLSQARMPGHAEGTLRGGVADGMPVITRAGGFGTATTLAELLRLTLET